MARRKHGCASEAARNRFTQDSTVIVAVDCRAVLRWDVIP